MKLVGTTLSRQSDSADAFTKTIAGLTFSASAGGAAGSGSTFTGAAAMTISYTTVGALSSGGGTLTGKLTTVTPTTSIASITLPHGTAPTTPVNGDMWTTTAGLFVRVNGTTIGPLTGGSGSGTVTSVAVTAANGVSATIANPTTAPNLTFTLGDITPTSVTSAGDIHTDTHITLGGNIQADGWIGAMNPTGIANMFIQSGNLTSTAILNLQAVDPNSRAQVYWRPDTNTLGLNTTTTTGTTTVDMRADRILVRNQLASTTIFDANSNAGFMKLTIPTLDVSLGGSSISLTNETTQDAPTSGTPSTGVSVFPVVRANRRQLAWIAPTGRSERFQAFLGANDIKQVDATGAGPTASATVGYTTIGANMAADVGSTFALPAMATTNFLSMQQRKTIAIPATANLMIEAKPTAAWCSRRSVGGGFHFSIRFGLETVLPATGRLFVGLTGATTALTNVDPRGNLANSVGIVKNSADSTLTMLFAPSTAASGTSLSLANTGAVGWNTAGTMFQLEIFCAKGDTGFGYRVSRWTPATGAVVFDESLVNTTALLPAIDTLFVPHLWAANVAATATTLAFVQMYCETD